MKEIKNINKIIEKSTYNLKIGKYVMHLMIVVNLMM